MHIRLCLKLRWIHQKISFVILIYVLAKDTFAPCEEALENRDQESVKEPDSSNLHEQVQILF